MSALRRRLSIDAPADVELTPDQRVVFRYLLHHGLPGAAIDDHSQGRRFFLTELAKVSRATR